MSNDSIQAVQACMSFLNLRLDKPNHEPIECFFLKERGSSGLMYITFRNDVHGHRGPYVTFDDTIRGFGIPHQEFKPAYYDFEFNSDEVKGILSCVGSGHTFHMTFNR